MPPPPPELRRRLIEALAYAAHEIGRLEVLVGHNAEPESGFLRNRDKAAAEALLLAYLALRAGDDDAELRAAATRLVDVAEQQIATPRNEAILRRFPQTVATLGVGYVLLDALGRGRPSVRAILQRAVAGGFAVFSERAPFRIMDTRWTFSQVALGGLGMPEDLLPFSIANGEPHPIYTMNEDEYALTHAIYYLTDFGNRPFPLPRLARTVDAFILVNAVRGDLDLLVEFLLARIVLRLPESPASSFGWHLVRAAWDTPAGLTGPEYSAGHHATLGGAQAEAYDFAENYHTRFVGGMACAVALTTPPAEEQSPTHATTSDAATSDAITSDATERCGTAVQHIRATTTADDHAAATDVAPEPPAPAALLEPIAAKLLTLRGEPVEPPPAWLATAMTCDLDRDQLAAILLDMLLVTACRNYALVHLADTLATAAPHPALRSPTFEVALNFLLNQQLDDGSYGIHALLAEGRTVDPTAQATIHNAILQVDASLHSPTRA